MTATHEWLSAAETFDALHNAGLRDSELVKILSQVSGWGQRLRSTGFPQVTIGDDHNSFNDRESTSIGHLWQYFCAAFWDGTGAFGERSTLLECDWAHGSFTYRVERDENDDRPANIVKCCINFQQNRASYSIVGEDGESETQFVWHSLQFDRLGVEALARQLKRHGNDYLQWTDKAIIHWWTDHGFTDGKEARNAFMKQPGAKGLSQLFESLWRQNHPDAKRGHRNTAN